MLIDRRRFGLAVSASFLTATVTNAADKKDSSTASGPLAMSDLVVCKEVRGYRDYDPLPDGEVTKDDKLLLYSEPTGFKIQPDKDMGYRAHLMSDGRIRKKGRKEVVFEKKKLMDYAVSAKFPPKLIYVKTFVQLKGLGPGEYELDVILRDVLGEERSVTRTIPFKIVAAKPVGSTGKSGAAGKKK